MSWPNYVYFSRRYFTSTVYGDAFRNAEKDEEHFEMCLRSLEEEIMFKAHHLLAFKEPLESGFNSQNQQKSGLKKKPSRGFCHALSELYIQESGEQLTRPTGDTISTVELSDTLGDNCYWEEIKGNSCKYYRNIVTNRYLKYIKPFTEQKTKAVCEKCGLY